jgi:TolA-binding protein
MDPVDVIEKLPFKKNATLSQIVLLILATSAVAVGGAMVKTYFDEAHGQIMAAIAKVDSDQTQRTTGLQKEVDDNTGSIEALRRYYWSNADMQRWAQQLDRQNRVSVPALTVPEVPPPPQPNR